MNTLKQAYCSLLLVGSIFSHASGQKQILAGLNVNSDFYSGSIRPSAGLVIETKFTKHSGLETGLFYRTAKYHAYIYYADSLGTYVYPFYISQRFLNIPVLYRYDSKIVTVSVGPTLDLYSGW